MASLAKTRFVGPEQFALLVREVQQQLSTSTAENPKVLHKVCRDAYLRGGFTDRNADKALLRWFKVELRHGDLQPMLQAKSIAWPFHQAPWTKVDRFGVDYDLRVIPTTGIDELPDSAGAQAMVAMARNTELEGLARRATRTLARIGNARIGKVLREAEGEEMSEAVADWGKESISDKALIAQQRHELAVQAATIRELTRANYLLTTQQAGLSPDLDDDEDEPTKN